MKSEHFTRLSQLILGVSRETFEDLCRYETFIYKWQSHINLVARSTVSDLWSRHIFDSAQLFPLQIKAQNWLDLGSGGGFPGIVIAILLKGRGTGHIDLVESNGKKAAFLRFVITSLSLPATVHCMRIENIYNIIVPPAVITARALTSLVRICEFIAPVVDRETVILIQKGRFYLQELSKAQIKWQFHVIEHTSIISQESVILEMRELQCANL